MKALEQITLEETWTSRKPNVSNLKVFGCHAFMHIPDKRRSKLDPKSIEYIMIRYSKNSKAYKCIDPKTDKIYVSRDVVFDKEDAIESQSQIQVIEEMPKEIPQEIPLEETFEITTEEIPKRSHEGSLSKEEEQTFKGPITEEEQKKEKRVPRWYIKTIKEGKGDIFPHKTRSQTHRALYISIEPQSFEEAKGQIEWKTSMDLEMNSIIKNRTWKLVELPPNKPVFNCKWIYKVKEGANGKIEKHKVGLQRKAAHK